MDRINHVKIASPDPAAIERFLREVVDVPEGWALGDPSAITSPAGVVSPARDADGNFSLDAVYVFRGTQELTGYIAGDTTSRQFQIVEAETPRIWGVAIGTRDLEGAHRRCVEHGFPCTDPDIVEWHGADSIRYFFAEVGGVVFEVIRVES